MKDATKMKQLLLGTSALVAAGLMSNGALAQTATTDLPVQLKIGGQYYAGAGAMIQQDDSPGDVAYKRNPIGMQDYFLLRFIGSTTFSNGITAGIWTRLNAFSAPFSAANTSSGYSSSNNTVIKDSYVYLRSAVWGEVRLGDDNDVRRTVAVGNASGAAAGDGNLGANSGSLQWLNTPVYNFTTANLDGRGTKIVYFTPTIMGFQFGASFTPDKGGGHTYGPGNVGDNSGLTDRITDGLTPSLINNNTAYDYWALSGQWTGTIGPAKVIGAVAYSTGSRKCGVSSGVTIPLGQNATPAQCTILGAAGTQNADPQIYNIGTQVDYGPFEVGVNYEHTQAIPGGLFVGSQTATHFNAAGQADAFVQKTNEMINEQVDLNLSYTIGAIRYGAEWSHGNFEGLTGDANVKRAVTEDEIELGGAYTVGPGVTLVAMVQEALYDAGGKYIPLTGGVQNIYAKDSNSTALIFETALKF